MEHSAPQDAVQDPPVVLVIDDELGPRESLRFLLKDAYRVLCAESVDSGLRLLADQSPDLTILDIRMPGKNGIEGLREIRAVDEDLSVILLTGFAAVDTAREAVRHEANDYVEKPFDAQEMRRLVRHHVEQTRLRRKRRKMLGDATVLEDRFRTLQERSRQMALGESSSEFVHDLRNALGAVNGSSILLRMGVEDLQQRNEAVPVAIHRDLDMLEASMKRCVAMLDTWQRLIMDMPQPFRPFRVHDLVRGCVDACQPTARLAGASLSVETRGDEAEIAGDPVQLARVLENLVHNALRALPERGGWVRVRSEILPESVRVGVSDNGCGIAEEHREQVFTPGFTTRRASGGTGLGLFISRKIARMHQGEILLESAVGRGATFTLVLPRTAAGVVVPA